MADAGAGARTLAATDAARDSAALVVKIGGGLLRRDGLDGLRRACDDAGALARARPVLVVPGGGPFADAVRDVDARAGLGDRLAHRLALAAMDQLGQLLAELLPDATNPLAELPPHATNPLAELLPDATKPLAELPPDATKPLAELPPDATKPLAELPPEGLESLRRAPRPAGIGLLLAAPAFAGRPEIPESWDVTSDSLAVYAAAAIGAGEALLLKPVAGVYERWPPPGPASSPAAALTTADLRDLQLRGVGRAVDRHLPDAIDRTGVTVTVRAPRERAEQDRRHEPNQPDRPHEPNRPDRPHEPGCGTVITPS